VSQRLDPVVLLILSVLLFLLALHVIAEGTPLGATRPGCVPAYWTMDPDATGGWHFEVRVLEPHRLRWRAAYVFVSLPCCQVTRNAVADLAGQVRDRTARITVGECR
jgi:hypothetical protein